MSKLVVINVLKPEYFGDCHIAGSINVPLDKLEEYAKELDKDTNIVVYCADYTCTASAQAWKKLHDMGFTNIWAYEGGANEWYHLGLPMNGMCRQKYLVEQVENPHENRGARTVTAEELKKMMASMDY